MDLPPPTGAPAPPATEPDGDKLARLLLLSSRTFAINIPMLPPPLDDAMAISYLLLRNADSIEDATGWPAGRQVDRKSVV